MVDDGRVPVEEGFRNQRLVVVPQPRVREALGQPVTRRLLVTAAGYYPDARDHLMSRPHGAPETILILCTSGTGWVRLGGQPHRVSAQHALVVPRHMPHSYGAGERHPWTIWWAHLEGTDVAELVGAMGASPARPLLPVRRIERVVALLDEVLTGLERNLSPARLVAASGAAWKLLTQLAVDRHIPAPDDPLHRAMTHLAERLDGAVRVPDLAGMVGVSPSHLSTLFRAATGGGVLAYQTGLRMARVRHLLDTTQEPIARIAAEVGYSDPLYFSRHFRHHHGMSPTQYRTRDARSAG